MNTEKCMIIAEAGINHNGDIRIALELVRAASEAGSDAVKFQTFRTDDLVTQGTAKADYQKQHTDPEESQHSMLRKLELSHDDHHKLVEACREHGITFLSTGFDVHSLAFLGSLKMPVFKIPSGELTNLPLLRQVAGFGKPVIMSTGMASLEEISASLEALEQAGATRSGITLLHCTTQYPTPMQNVNLRAMLTLGETFPGVSIGYSDHTLGIEVPIAAAALGARVLEKHFTLDRSMKGPDHAASLEPEELKNMVTAVRNIELAMGSGVKEPCAEEISTRAVARKAIVAACPIREGEVFSEKNLTVKRSGSGISPMLWDQLLDCAALQDYARDETINHPLS
ncbi:MAG: N-acetylneuraminate synthase [Akkermansiaceae bacterium]|nr:N-acetylneuraminate synthase [Akkermansiaceae bacterium]